MSAPPREGAPDPRSIITPDSFSVRPELVGLPLARPMRRLGAMLLDLVPVAVLLNANAFFFAMAGAILLWRASAAPGGGKAGQRRIGRALFRGAATLMLFLAILRTFEAIGDRGEQPEPAPTWEDPERWTAANSELPYAQWMRPGAVHTGTAPDSIAGTTDSLVLAYAAALENGDTAAVDSLRPAVQNAVAGASMAALAQTLQALQRENAELERRADSDRGSITGFLGGIAEDLGIGFGWAAIYFTVFLVIWNGQTPGKRMLGIQVIRLDGRPIGWWLAFERFGGYAASIWTGLLGFAQILWDRNRQAIHDKITETVVINVRVGGPYRPVA
jgi:hypothetical protein